MEIVYTGLHSLNVTLLLFFAVRLLRRKHIVNLLAGLSVSALAVYEAGNALLSAGVAASARVIGAGFCLAPVMWMVLSVSLLPPRSSRWNRVILTPVFVVLSLVFFLVWWINPFVRAAHFTGGAELALTARYFFVLVVFDCILALSNLERAWYYRKDPLTRRVLLSGFLFLVPFVFISTYAVFLSKMHVSGLAYSAGAVLIGCGTFWPLARRGFGLAEVKEDVAVNTSMTLFLLGGYLFLIGAFVKLFQWFGWNLSTLFSFLTTGFVLLALMLLLFSPTVKQRLKTVMMRHFTRQKYDWQKLWEDFTYRISLVTDIEELKQKIGGALQRIMGADEARIVLFEERGPFEPEFEDWMLRRAGAFGMREVQTEAMKKKYPRACAYLEASGAEMAAPLYGDKKVIGLIFLSFRGERFVDRELLKLITLQASGVIVNCWAYRALQEAEKKESLYKVSSFVIHDVKNYINHLSLLVSNRDKFGRKDFQEDALFTIESTIVKMQKLIDEFRTLRGEVSVRSRACAVAGVVNGVLKEMGETRLRGVDVRNEVPADIVVVSDPDHLYKTVLNVALNAVEAMQGRGRLEFHAEEKENQGILEVRDTGPGMTQDFLETKLFTPFSSTKSKGLGIGLYQCKTIIEANHGRIEAESTPGEGTVFRIALPAAGRGPAVPGDERNVGKDTTEKGSEYEQERTGTTDHG
ncbi:MAG: hypothetical protein GF333_03115 [Candidatus Omnitrophica bacterium]|nr:hypothetical protein [Candidatus Omnitrophota bacterium]